MAVLRLVVDRRAPLHDLLQRRGVEDLAWRGGAPDFLGQRQRARPSPSAMPHQRRARIRVERQRLCPRSARRAPAAFRSPPRRAARNTSTRARDSSAALSSNDGFSVVAPTSTMVPSSITGRKRILLGAIEAMDFVDEQQRALPGLAPRRAPPRTPSSGRRRRRKSPRSARNARSVSLRQQSRDRGLAGARRPPEDHRAERARRQHAGERAIGAEQMILADDLGRALAGAAGRRADAARPCPARRRRTGSDRLRFGARASSAEHRGNRLSAARM